MENSFEMEKIFDNSGLWPCVLRLVLEAMSNNDANNFSMTCKTAKKVIQMYRPEIQQVRILIRNGCGYDMEWCHRSYQPNIQVLSVRWD